MINFRCQLVVIGRNDRRCSEKSNEDDKSEPDEEKGEKNGRFSLLHLQ